MSLQDFADIKLDPVRDVPARRTYLPPENLGDVVGQELADQFTKFCAVIRDYGYGSVTLHFNRGHPQRVEVSHYYQPPLPRDSRE